MTTIIVKISKYLILFSNKIDFQQIVLNATTNIRPAKTPTGISFITGPAQIIMIKIIKDDTIVDSLFTPPLNTFT